MHSNILTKMGIVLVAGLLLGRSYTVHLYIYDITLSVENHAPHVKAA